MNHLRKEMASHDGERDFYNETKPDLSFSLIHYQKVIVATNKEMSYAKFILNLLNSFSVWFGVRIVNAPLYALAFKRLLRRTLLFIARKKRNRVLSRDQGDQEG